MCRPRRLGADRLNKTGSAVVLVDYRFRPQGAWRRMESEDDTNGAARAARKTEEPVNPAWRAFIRYCRELGHGEIERLCIQDGVPVLAEVTKKKIKFTR